MTVLGRSNNAENLAYFLCFFKYFPLHLFSFPSSKYLDLKRTIAPRCSASRHFSPAEKNSSGHRLLLPFC